MAETVLELIRLEQALIGYERPLLPPLDLTIRRKERWAVLGPNGAGKSTLLRSLIGLLPLRGGHRHVASPRPRIGYVPQSHRFDAVYPLSTLEVVLQGRYGKIGVGRFVRSTDRAAALAQLQRVGLKDRASTPFRLLSGGQRQRVLLARALCAEPEALFLDEFTSDLDPAASAALLAEVTELTRELELATVFVTHEISAAYMHSTHVALVDTRRRVFEQGATEALLTSERLTQLYGQPMTLERRGERIVVFVETPTQPPPEQAHG